MKLGIVFFDIALTNIMVSKTLKKSMDVPIPLGRYAFSIDSKTNEYQEYTNFDKNSLPNDVLWFSNLDKETLWLSGYLITHDIKDNMFFNTPTQAIFKMIATENLSNQENFKRLLFVFQKLIALSMYVTKADFDNHIGHYSYAMSFNHKKNNIQYDELMSGILPFLHIRPMKAINDTEYNAIQKNNTRRIFLKKNGVLYVENVLNKVILPNMSSHKDQPVLRGYEMEDYLKQYCINHFWNYNGIQNTLSLITDTPFLVNVSDRVAKPHYNKQRTLIESMRYGRTVNQNHYFERAWITSEEFHMLSKYTTFGITGVMFLEPVDNKKIIEHYQLDLLETSNISYLSLISCIFIENHFVSMMEKNRETNRFDLVAAFLSAAEKKELFELSMTLINSNFSIGYIGNNRIELFINNESDIDELNKIISTYGYFVVE